MDLVRPDPSISTWPLSAGVGSPLGAVLSFLSFPMEILLYLFLVPVCTVIFKTSFE